MPETDDDTPDVTPPVVRELLILGWLLLFGGRWLLFPVLQLLGVLAPDQVAVLDETILLRCYLVLLAFTILIAVLRVVRAAQSGSPRSHPPLPNPAAPSAEGDSIRD